ncbi:acetolactate synthase [Gigaspora margarita]|uniref:Acetolactate synthase n=1 Tax=Gigaspora margarita TaxID=4874 RepID=A0A8H4EPK4_GIGMA|nr:acetolactate synthase [Gigaspora margarita]
MTTGVGQHQMWAAQFFRWRYPRTMIASGSLGTMGYGLPAAIGAKVACPDKVVIDISGDAEWSNNVKTYFMKRDIAKLRCLLERKRTEEELPNKIAEFLKYNDGPLVCDAITEKHEHVYPMMRLFTFSSRRTILLFHDSFGIPANCRILSQIRPGNQITLFSMKAITKNDMITKDGTKDNVFESSNFRLARLLKFISISFLGVACTVAPISFFYMDDPTFKSFGITKDLVAAALMASATSTFMVHHFFSRYVTKIYLHQPKTLPTSFTPTTINPYTKMTIETRPLFALLKLTTVELRHLNPMNRSYITWIVKKKVFGFL